MVVRGVGYISTTTVTSP